MLGPAKVRDRSPAGGQVVVCGAGAAGMAAALGAARCGADVLLVEAASQPGGTVAAALIHTIGGLYDSAGKVINEGLPRELIERLSQADRAVAQRKMGRTWVLQVCPNTYRRTTAQWIDAETRIESRYNARVTQVALSGGRIIELEIETAQGVIQVSPRAVIDATGSAAIVRLIDPKLVEDSERRAAGGWIFRLRNVAAHALESTKRLAIIRALREAANSGTLPGDCRHAWIDNGMHEDEVFVKLFIPLVAPGHRLIGPHDVEQQALATQAEIVAFLRQFPDFSRAIVAQTGSLGVRDGGRIRGRYVLSGDDVRAGRSFADGVCRCAWPIEFWDPDQGVSIEYLPAGSSYQIPMRSLQLMGVESFWVAGKCLSADRQAHASARVAGTCWAMGQAVGQAAAASRVDSLEQQHELEPIRPVSANCAATA